MLNLNFNTLYSKLAEQERGYNQPTVSASFFLYGAGGAGAYVTVGDNPNFRGGGGGGAGMVVSGSINITPDAQYTFVIPTGSLTTDTKGGDSFFNGYDNDTLFPISVRAGGGFRAPSPNSADGGNSGDGVYNHPNFTASYSAKTGGDAESPGYGGGAGSHQNGGSPTGGSFGVTQKGGNGGNGITSSITLWGWQGTLGSGISYLEIGSAGGGGGDKAHHDVGGVPPTPGNPGSVGGGTPTPGTPVLINGQSPGAGGGGDTLFTGVLGFSQPPIPGPNNSGVGFGGALVITYAGIPKLQFSGSVVTNYDAVNNATAHLVIYNSATDGTGSFLRSSGGPFDNNPNP
jgi:hypothetical protein